MITYRSDLSATATMYRMANRKFPFVPGEYYHLYNRGNSKQDIFLDNPDYVRFQRLLYLSNTVQNFKIDAIRDQGIDFYSFERGEHLVAIGAYCLMPNHFHILLTPLVERGVSTFMRKLSTGYSMYFNNKYERTGGLFEGRFKATHAIGDVYLKYLYSYIHLNPLKLIDPQWRENMHKNKKEGKQYSYVRNYVYSSCVDYLDFFSRQESGILEPNLFPKYFQSDADAQSHLTDWFSDRSDLSEQS